MSTTFRLVIVCLVLVIWTASSNNLITLIKAAKAPNGIETSYASSLFRSQHLLDNVLTLARLEEVPRLHLCLTACMNAKPNCKAFNYGVNGTCILLGESLCANETYELTEHEDFNYYDLMASPESEVKNLKYHFKFKLINFIYLYRKSICSTTTAKHLANVPDLATHENVSESFVCKNK